MAEYKALYRKWRPMTFDDICGQEAISETLKNSIKSGRIAHAYLFTGTRGTGKTTSAKIFARAVNCQSPVDGNPCNQCEICRGIIDGSILDVYEMDAASNSGVSNIREIRDEVIYAPADCKYKVYIIDEAHMLTTEAFNALLKTLEEPPAHVIFILATTEPQNIIPTVLSRCQRYDFRRISIDKIASRIGKITETEGIKITPDATELIAELADGSMRDGLSILEQCAQTKPDGLKYDDVCDVVGIVDKTRIFEIAEKIIENDAGAALEKAGEILNMGLDAVCLFEDLINHFRALMICKATPDAAALLEKTPETTKKYQEQSEKISNEKIMFCINILSENMLLAKKLQTPRVAVEMTMVKLCTPESVNTLEGLLERVSKLEKLVSEGTSLKVVKKDTPKSGQPEVKEEKEEAPLPVAEHISDSTKWDKWQEAVKTIKEESKTLYTFLFNAEALYFGDEIELVLTNDLAYSKVGTTEGKKYLSDMFSKIQGEKLKVVVSKKGNLKDRALDGPSILDIAGKKDLLGDKMKIIE